MQALDVLIIGAGAAGLMCAIEAGKRGRRVLVLDHANKVGKKILMSGGGRCNFTNYQVSPERYLSHNPHFCKSALSRYTQWDFLALVKKHRIAFHEKTLGQLFCDNKASDIVNMLLAECDEARVEIQLQTAITRIAREDDGHFTVCAGNRMFRCQSLVIATGGLSIPTMGATAFAWQVAEQFGLATWKPSPGLVPFTLDVPDKTRFAGLSGVSVDVEASNARAEFRESLLFTHRGLSGPSMLQMSSFWQPGEWVRMNLLPDTDVELLLRNARSETPQKQLATWLSQYLPRRLVDVLWLPEERERRLADFSNRDIAALAETLHDFRLRPNGTEGYRTAEVTLGGVNVDALSSKTMEVRTEAGLYFIGEAVDVTGWLGGYNFQWAWSSGWVAGQVA
ncbi:flavoprotein [Legionella geestiana]|uniref:Flavoprotein n=1 Tax=Legionella geestiana TaxID=45065 RepID=A0A0W0TP34_9GAMM|nr:NAD(P)/FAD-dependent oxidoreductase [Legionella geestiana]KTC97362.1 flavoprotein [Legionella geestiana]QBS12486.1 NAD(P)/FAD-dependent oxidoreductase [Legionella geestiana]QDQ39799.1 NAD(P)/FAD-dependent oxidoreductase [Legionella geestiana]STX55070.1 flavoprotein [Legionella geestiana]